MMFEGEVLKMNGLTRDEVTDERELSVLYTFTGACSYVKCRVNSSVIAMPG
jgi:hypothetical protein